MRVDEHFSGLIQLSFLCVDSTDQQSNRLVCIPITSWTRGTGEVITVDLLLTAAALVCKLHLNIGSSIVADDLSVIYVVCSWNVVIQTFGEICVLKKRPALLLICRRRSTSMQRKTMLLQIQQVGWSLLQMMDFVLYLYRDQLLKFSWQLNFF